MHSPCYIACMHEPKAVNKQEESYHYTPVYLFRHGELVNVKRVVEASDQYHTTDALD